MTDHPPVANQLRRAAELIGDDLTPPTAMDLARRWSQRRRSLVAAAAAVIVTVTGASVLAVVASNPRDNSTASSHAPSASLWLTYRVPTYGFTVEYPKTWVPSAPQPPSPAGFNEPVATLGTVRIVTTCRTADSANSCTLAAERRLHAGDVVEQWTSTTGPAVKGISSGPVRANGTPTQISGHDAWVRVTRSRPLTGTCKITGGSASGGTRQVDVSIAISNQQSLDMSACLAGSPRELDQLQAQVQRSAASVHIDT